MHAYEAIEQSLTFIEEHLTKEISTEELAVQIVIAVCVYHFTLTDKSLTLETCFFQSFIRCNTGQLILRPLRKEDVVDLKEWLRDSSVYRYWGKRPGKSTGVLSFASMNVTRIVPLVKSMLIISDMTYQLKIIGKVKNDETGTFIQLEPEYIPGLQALEGFNIFQDYSHSTGLYARFDASGQPFCIRCFFAAIRQRKDLSRSLRIRCYPCGKLYQTTIPRATYGKNFLLLQVRKK